MVKEYFDNHPGTDRIAATHLMPLFIRQGIFLKNTENGLTIRVILREFYKTGQLKLLISSIIKIDKRIYYFNARPE